MDKVVGRGLSEVEALNGPSTASSGGHPEEEKRKLRKWLRINGRAVRKPADVPGSIYFELHTKLAGEDFMLSCGLSTGLLLQASDDLVKVFYRESEERLEKGLAERLYEFGGRVIDHHLTRVIP